MSYRVNRQQIGASLKNESFRMGGWGGLEAYALIGLGGEEK